MSSAQDLILYRPAPEGALGRVAFDALLTRRIVWTPRPLLGLWGACDGLFTGRIRAVVTSAGFEPAISTLKGSRPVPG